MADFTTTKNETATAADTGFRAQAVSVREDETATAADTGFRAQAVSVREDETATAADTVIEEDNYRKQRAEFGAAADGVSVQLSTGYERSEAEILYVVDGSDTLPNTSWLPRKVYVRHMNKMIHKRGVPPFSPAIAVQYRDWSNSRTSGLLRPTGPTDGNTPIFRKGSVTPILAEVFADWTSSPKGMIAQHMMNGELEVYEDYLGSTRKLTPGQVMQYTMNSDQPWATWVLHRGPLTAADAGGPTTNNGGTLAVDFKNILIRPIFVGGTSPTVSLTVWAREATAPRGIWVAVGSVATLSGQTTIQTDYREVYVQVTAVAGSPTSFNIEISGTSA